MSKKFLASQALSDIKSQGSIIYFENIIDGFNDFAYISLEFGDYKGYIGFISHVLTGGLSASFSDYSTYFDFYYHLLEPLEQQNFKRLVQEIGIVCSLDEFDFEKNKSKDNIFFEFDYSSSLHRDVVDFIASVSFSEILFSTFYLASEASDDLCMTLWTDYKGRIHVFFEKNESSELLRGRVVELAKVYGFKII